MHLTLLKLMRRFVQADQLKDVHGSALQSVSCQDIKDRLPDGELVIGNNTRKYLALLKPDKQKAALLGIRAFWGAAVSHLQAKLPLNNRVLKDLGHLLKVMAVINYFPVWSSHALFWPKQMLTLSAAFR